MAGVIKKGVLALILLAALLFGFFWFYGTTIVKDSVVEYGPGYTGTSVQLNNVSFSPLDGRAGLTGFEIGSPAGFESEKMFSVGNLQMKVDTTSLMSDTVYMEEIRIADPELVVEFKDGKLNYDVLSQNIEANAPASETETTTNVAIKDLYITGGKVSVVGLPLGSELSELNLPDIHLQDIGIENEEVTGVTFGQATEIVIGTVTTTVTRVVADANLQGLLGGLGDNLEGGKEGLMDKVKGLFGGEKDDEEDEGGN